MMAAESTAPDKGTARMIIGFIGVLAVMMAGGVLYFAVTNATTMTNPQNEAATQWVLPVLISFASIPMTALVTLATTRVKGDESTASTTTTTMTSATPPQEPPVPESPQPLMMSGPASALSTVGLVDSDHVPGSDESMTAGVQPPPQ